MSNTQQSNNGQNSQRQRGSPPQGQQSQPNQSARGGGDQLWNNMNARVGNTAAQPIDPRLVVQAVGPIQGVVPTQPATNQPQQTVQGGVGQSRQPTMTATQPPTAMQGANSGTYRSQPQAMNVAQPQQPVPNPQGQQQFRFRTPMTNNQQGQGGNAPFGNVGVGRGGGPIRMVRGAVNQLVPRRPISRASYGESADRGGTKETILKPASEGCCEEQ